MRRMSTMLCGVAIGVIVTLTVAAAQPRGKAADEVIAITKAEWAAAMAKNASAAMKNVADDCTMWVPDFPNRIDGKDTIYSLTEVESGGAGNLVLAEMANEKVQVYGDIAVLSYNFMGMAKDKDGKIEPIKAKSSRVYIKEGRQWWLVHANFAPVTE